MLFLWSLDAQIELKDEFKMFTTSLSQCSYFMFINGYLIAFFVI